MRAIITGSKGFIGKAFAQATKDIFTEQILVDEEILIGDWKTKISNLFQDRPDVVFHFGACSDTSNFNLQEMMLKNVLTSNHLADLCATYRIPFIFSSSASVYGSIMIDKEFENNLSLYAYSKLIAEQYAIKSRGVALRYFNVYGHDERHKAKMSSVALQVSVHKAVYSGYFYLFPRKPRRDFVYIKDVISANLHAFENYDSLLGDYYDVGYGEARLFEDVLDIMGVKYRYRQMDCFPDYYQYYTRAGKFMPDWSPDWSLEKGLADYMKIMATYRWEWKQFREDFDTERKKSFLWTRSRQTPKSEGGFLFTPNKR